MSDPQKQTRPAASTREWLRSLPVFTTPSPDFDPARVPEAPVDLFLEWLADAASAGVQAAHAMTVSTATPETGPDARIVILKDVDDDGWQFASNTGSPKGRALAEDPRAALTFFWPTRGRQVRIVGVVEAMPDELAAADFLARPEASRSSTLVGRQSEPLASQAEYETAAAAARERVQAEPDIVAPGWTVFLVRPLAVEFWQASRDRAHLRVRYERESTGPSSPWSHGMLWP
ncbi:pyridoxine/pyridoxamine 5'-phosphate oxidase [Plantibacter sp. YIM 135249]|uniref:pyridoxine/pyridoxamine 5'-phosphate oxidase n=1 Tax=Plantibacter sp. YIM 135249 TaxID=3423918 RepID=UPI003D34F3F8